MALTVVIILGSGCAILMIAERMGAPTTLELTLKGDVKRETRWLAQYGQAVCTVVVALLVWQLSHHDAKRTGALVIAVAGTSLVAAILKRTLGRVRPRREKAGRFLGPALRHANYRESFPSSHSACAVALTVVLARYYPEAAATFWVLAIVCAVLRYVLDAHWPSDVLGGVLLGYVAANVTLNAFHF